MVLGAALAGDLARAQSTERVSVGTGGAEANAGGEIPSISADGRFVAFQSWASDLVAGDTNGFLDVFVRDRQAGTTERVSVATGGAQGNHFSVDASISADGRFVAFWSHAWNLVAGDTNGRSDVFVRDRQSGTTERVSVSSGGLQANDDSQHPSISADGRFVAFGSLASFLVAGDTNGFTDVFVRDRLSGTTELVSVATSGAQGNSVSYWPSISADGRIVAFRSSTSNLVAGDTNGVDDILVRDRQSGTTQRMSVATGGTEGNAWSWFPSVSGGGRFVAFRSRATNLVAGDSNGFDDVFVHDRRTGTTERVSVASGGAQGDADSGPGSISADGRFVAFQSYASNLVPGDTYVSWDVFVRDRQSGTTERASVALGGGQGDSGSFSPSISADGRFVALHSNASNLVAGDTNGAPDVFVRDRGIPPAISPYCVGDGSGTVCPCGNSAAGNGCPNSTNANGANLAASGTASIAADTLVLAGSGMPNSYALYLQGTTQLGGGAGVVFGDGLLCAGGSIIRLGTQSNVSGASRYPAPGDLPVSVRGLVTAPGVRTYQVWYRNAADFCTPPTFNLTNGLEVIWSL